VGLVVAIVRVSEGLVNVDILRDARNQLGGAGVAGRLQVEVLDALTFDGLGLVAQRLGDELVDGLDALDNEVALLVGATDDAGGGDVLEKNIHVKTLLVFDLSIHFFPYRFGVLTAGAGDDVALGGGAQIVEDGENAALVKVAVLNDLVDGEVLAKLGDGKEFLLLGLDLFDGQAADVIPGLALTSRATLHGVVDGVLSVVVVVLVLLEDSRALVELHLDLSGQSALEVDDPEGLLLADGDALNLAGDDLDLHGLLEVLLVNDADLLAGVGDQEFLHNIFVELLSLGVQELRWCKEKIMSTILDIIVIGVLKLTATLTVFSSTGSMTKRPLMAPPETLLLMPMMPVAIQPA